MVDKLNAEQRSRTMSRVASRNTRPELFVRSALHAAGFRFRLHGRRLPGTPDVVLPAYRTAVFVHGCFWHGHDCRRGKRPTTNETFWNAKIDRNQERDRTATAALVELGWRVVTVWGCELEDKTAHLIAMLTEDRNRRRDRP